MRDLLVYSLLRIALFAVVWWLLTLAGLGVFLAGMLAALVAMLASILLLKGPRQRAAERWQAADEQRRSRRAERASRRSADEDEEDSLVEGR